jgi:putative FmdB family regulatory protein
MGQIAMPIYAYECKACGHEFDAIQKISDAPLVECPACQKNELKKLLSAPSFRLSGSGWYETDFKKDKKKNLAGEQGSSTATSTSAAAESSSSGSATKAADAS